MNDEANKEQQEEAPTGDGHPEVIMTFSSHPIMNFSLAGFQFTKGTLQFRAGDEERLAAFEKLYDSLPPMEKNRIKKIDVAAAEKLLAELKAKEGGPTQKIRSEEHTSELQSLMRTSYAVFCWKKKTKQTTTTQTPTP